jgi:hypothetical protein
MIQSSVWQAAWAEGRAEGLRATRDLCLELIRRRHPALLTKATPVVEACEDHALLCDWILRAEALLFRRDACLELIRKRHPALLTKATPVIEACEDQTLLLDWILNAGDLDDAALARLLHLG